MININLDATHMAMEVVLVIVIDGIFISTGSSCTLTSSKDIDICMMVCYMMVLNAPKKE